MNELFIPYSTDELCVDCPDCKEHWSSIDEEIGKIEETKDAQGVDDPMKRNEVITDKYKKIAEKNPENRWAKLASYVSAQVGCGMEEADGFFRQAFGESWASVDPDKAKAALADGNITIFKSVGRPFMYVNKYGYENFYQCLESAPPGPGSIPDELVMAMRSMQEGELRDAADMIAKHEQVDVVAEVYERHQDTFAAIDAYDTSWRDFNTTRDLQSIPLSYECTGEGKVLLEGPLSDKDNRVAYYEKLMEKLEVMEGWK